MVTLRKTSQKKETQSTHCECTAFTHPSRIKRIDDVWASQPASETTSPGAVEPQRFSISPTLFPIWDSELYSLSDICVLCALLFCLSHFRTVESGPNDCAKSSFSPTQISSSLAIYFHAKMFFFDSGRRPSALSPIFLQGKLKSTSSRARMRRKRVLHRRRIVNELSLPCYSCVTLWLAIKTKE